MFAALILALGMSGLAYAHWEKIITIEGTVTTGTFHLTPSCDIWVEDPLDKPWVAEVHCEIVGNTVTYTIGNAFPCLTVAGMFDLHNDGDIPAGLHDVIITPPAGVTIVDLGGYMYEVYDGTDLIANLSLELVGDFEQIDPCDEVYVYWWIHFKEDLPQDTTYTFMIELVYYNWNEA